MTPSSASKRPWPFRRSNSTPAIAEDAKEEKEEEKEEAEPAHASGQGAPTGAPAVPAAAGKEQFRRVPSAGPAIRSNGGRGRITAKLVARDVRGGLWPTTYAIRVEALDGRGSREEVHRRFNDFAALRAALVETCPSATAMPPLPPKGGILRKSVSPAFMVEREKKLGALVEAAVEVDPLATCPALRAFLGLGSGAFRGEPSPRKDEKRTVIEMAVEEEADAERAPVGVAGSDVVRSLSEHDLEGSESILLAKLEALQARNAEIEAENAALRAEVAIGAP